MKATQAQSPKDYDWYRKSRSWRRFSKSYRGRRACYEGAVGKALGEAFGKAPGEALGVALGEALGEADTGRAAGRGEEDWFLLAQAFREGLWLQEGANSWKGGSAARHM